MRKLTLFSLTGNPGGGATNELLDTVSIKSGNNDILKETKARRLVEFSHERDFVGDMGAAIMAASYSHDVSMSNACLGFVSFDQVCSCLRLRAFVRFCVISCCCVRVCL